LVSLLVRRGEEAVDPRGLRGTKGCVDKVNKEEVEEEAEEEVEEEVEKEALLPYRGVKCNILCIMYIIKRLILILGNRFICIKEILGKMLIYYS
jgi:hypothetical protein